MDAFLKPMPMIAQVLLGRLASVFLAPGSVFSVASLASALVIAAACIAWPRWRRGRAVKARVLARALFPGRIVRSASSRADFGLFLFNTFPAIVLLGWALLSARQVGHATAGELASLFGSAGRPLLSPTAGRALATLSLFLAYELAYWFDHYLSHRVPALWEFHKVHHTAEVLSPLTVFRVHPLDSLVFANITAIVVGLTAGVLQYLLGAGGSPVVLSGNNVILVGFVFLTIHLQHSHLWISFPGTWGRIFLSPAHHQIHHSANPAHFNRNFGSCLSVWDWVFGTLHLPSRRREALTFGAAVRTGAPSPHSVSGVLLEPFGEAARRLAPPARRRDPVASA
jgi:sterol desaturase/sphingolipid hydroxylase (fatty acid hydroxylase superfamily)